MLDDRSHCQGRSRSGGGESGEGAVDEKHTIRARGGMGRAAKNVKHEFYNGDWQNKKS